MAALLKAIGCGVCGSALPLQSGHMTYTSAGR